MTITLNDAIYRLRSKLDEPAYPTLPMSTVGNPPPRFYTDTELTIWVNDALKDIARRAEDLWTYDTSINIPAYGENPNQPVPTFPLPTDILRINRIEFQVYNDSSQIYPLEASTQQYMDNIWSIDQLSTMSYPAYYVTRGYPGGTGRNLFVIQIFPNAAQAGNLNIFYYRDPIYIPDPVANPANYLTTLDITNGWDDLVVDYAYMQALIKKRDPQWQMAQSMYEAKMGHIIDMTRRFNDQPQYFTYDTLAIPWAGDSWGGW